MSGFVHLHVHTEYSLLDGACNIKKMMPLLKKMGQNSIAMTDHGVMFGTMNFYKEAKKAGIKPIIGCEVYTAARTRFDKIKEFDGSNGHLVLLCKNNIGYNNLIELVSFSNLEGFYYKPRVDLELLKKYHEGIIAMSACIAGDVPQKILQNDYQGAKTLALNYLEIFGKDNYYLEIQDHGIPEQKIINEGLIKLSKETGIPLVATNDAHYLEKKDSKAQKVLVCVQIQKKIDEESGMGFDTDEFYLKSEEEMRDLFEYIPEAIDNTAKIAEMCNVSFPVLDNPNNIKYILPDFKWTEGLSHYEYMRKVTINGFNERYTAEQQTPELWERLEYELEVIQKMGFVDYFLIVWDFIKYAKDNGIPIGPGRGSGAGSIVAYCMRITNIEPIRYNLLFERFLNPERISMPDFDIDICTERRAEVIEYVKQKYGEANVAQIATFGTMKAKLAVRDVARVLNFQYSEADAIAKLIPDRMTVKEAIDSVPELRDRYETDERVQELLDMSESIENSPRHASVHAAGIVITEEPVYKYAPLTVADGLAVIQFDMKTVESIGLVKMDFLGLRNLTVIEEACSQIRKKIPDFVIEHIDFEDKETFEMLSQGKTDGVFQLESGGMRQTLIGLRPKSIEEIIAVISLYRPGPMDSIPTYTYNRLHPEKVTYKHPLLKDILKVTHGCMVYQEQVMQIVRTLAGYSYGRADIVRRAMGKKQADVMAKEREYFVYGKMNESGEIEVPGAIRNGVPEDTANSIFDEMVKFAEYAFNKSHAAAYAFVAYYTAYLGCHFQKEYMAALLTSVVSKPDKMVGYIVASQNHGIEIMPPDINKSEIVFSVEDNGIRFGLIALKNVGKNVVANIVAEREQNGNYKSFYDFCERIMTNYDIDSRTVESLIRCGAFDSFKNKRKQLELAFPDIRKSLQLYIKEKEEGQFSLFGEIEEKTEYIYPDIDEYEKKEKLTYEKEVTGIYISEHPMKEYAPIAEKNNYPTIVQVNTENEIYANNKRVSIIGILAKVTKKMTKNETMMAILQLQDLTGNIEVLLFSKSYEAYSSLLAEDKIVIITGKISIKEDNYGDSHADDENAADEPRALAKIICNEVREIHSPKDNIPKQKKGDSPKDKKLLITFTKNDNPNFDRCVNLLMENRGESHVFFNFTDLGKQARFTANNVEISDRLILELRELLDPSKIVIRS